MSDPMWIFCFC